jgi:1,5-anhydro-D-fructose reductase (1,5-anhydro-D-mannitol-forming)
VTSVTSVIPVTHGVRWGLIGAGDIVRKRVAGALRDAPASEIAAVSRGRTELAQSFAQEIGARRWHGDWRALVADTGVTAVYIATPVHVHAAQTIAAAEAGKHVLCEKPMAMSAGECDRMIAACRANGVRLGIAYYRRFYPAVIRVKDIIASGEIGEPVFAQMNAFEHFNPGPNHPRAWLVQPFVAGGGPMMDFGCHRIEVLLNLFGAVRQTAAITSNAVFKREVEDTAAVLLRFDGGPCASVAVTHASHERQDTLHVFGTRGAIHVDDLNAGVVRVRTDAWRIEQHPPASNVHQPIVDDFVDAVLRGREPAVTGETGRAVAAIEDAIYAVAPSAR